MAGKLGQFGSFGEKIAAAIQQAQTREDAYTAAALATPSATLPYDPGSSPTAAQGTGAPVNISPSPYGDLLIIPVIFPGAGDLFVLERPKNNRVLLIIYNSLAANPINFAFGRAADNVSGIPIAAAGNAFFDVAVPQNDLHIFSPVAGTILVAYMNT